LSADDLLEAAADGAAATESRIVAIKTTLS
jgi:hypothetical protein